MRVTTLAATLLVLVSLTGCYESTSVTLHEPGVYKGSDDPLLALDDQAQEEALRKRFEEGQAPR
ncbi:MAG: hypothetical protein PVI25_05820 [Gammaproteobacteria bacterium]|jgi:hypothetical protein|nr:MAG: hypothetical protein AMJ59_13020 [Gammaproteobacteria bacterium SG8_31]